MYDNSFISLLVLVYITETLEFRGKVYSDKGKYTMFSIENLGIGAALCQFTHFQGNFYCVFN